MNKKLLCTLIAGVTLGVTAPVFADSFHHDRGYDHNRYSHDYDRHGYRDRYEYRGYAHRPFIVERPYVVQRPVYVEQPVYYGQSQPNLGIGAMIGAAIGSIYDSRQ
jgi:hypothetical protein